MNQEMEEETGGQKTVRPVDLMQSMQTTVQEMKDIMMGVMVSP